MTAGAPGFLVTGGTGFLGRHVLFALRRLQPSARLLVLVRNAAAWRAQEWAAGLGAVEALPEKAVATCRRSSAFT